MIEANDALNPTRWMTIHDPINHMQASFPHHPIEMTFDLPFQNIPPVGHLHVFSSSTKEGVFILSALSLSTVNEQLLQGDAFKKIFESYLVPRLFYSPHLFHKQQEFSWEKSQFKDMPALFFQFTYRDHHSNRILKGLTTVKNRTLYSIFYLATEAEFKEEAFLPFIHSFDLSSL